MGAGSKGTSAAAEEDVSLMAEAKLFARIAAPAVVMQFFTLLQRSVTAMCVGSWLGPVPLTGYSLGNLAGSLCTLSIMMGILSAMDTLAPQAMGAKRHAEVGLLAQRAAAVCLLLFLPLSVLWFNAEPIMLYLNQPPASAAYTGQLLRVTVFSMPGTIIFEVQKRFLTSQAVVWPLAGIAVAVAAMQPLFMYFFVKYLELGFDGVGLALCASQWVCPLLTWLYIRWFTPHNPATWTGFNRAALDPVGMIEFLKLGLPGILTMSEWWFWEVTCFTAGMIGAQPLAAHTVVYNLIPIMFMLSFGFSMGVTIRVGHLLAERKIATAKSVAKAGMSAGACTLCVATALVYMDPARDFWKYLFTPSADSLELVGGGDAAAAAVGEATVVAGVLADIDEIWPLVMLFLIVDGLYALNGGLMRGLGLQARNAMATFVSLWVCGIPIIYFGVLGQGWGLYGLWFMLWPLYTVLCTLQFIGYTTKSWEDVSDKIVARLRERDIAMGLRPALGKGEGGGGGAGGGEDDEGEGLLSDHRSTEEKGGGKQLP